MLSVADQITAEVREELRKLMNPTKEDFVSASNGSPAEYKTTVALTREQIEDWRAELSGVKEYRHEQEEVNALCDMALRSMGGWIPVSERLPEQFAPVVLINVTRWENSYDPRNVQDAGYLDNYGNGAFWSVRGEPAQRLEAFTHWMPLPPPPVSGSAQDSIESK